MKLLKILFIFTLIIINQSELKAQRNTAIQVFNVEALNTKALEFSPAFYHTGLVFVSSQYRHGRKDNTIDENTFELLYSDFGPGGKLSKAYPLSLTINTQYHEGPVCFSKDWSKMYFTQSNLQDGKPVKDATGKVRMKIYEATKGKTDWENQRALSFNSNQFSCMHPSLSKDGSRMYFASNRPGGFGGMDLYYSEWKDGFWDDPVNLGPEINTANTEAFPFIHPSGKLFFASNRANGIGGLDIYMAGTGSSKNKQMTLLPAPINSVEDDFGFILSNKGVMAYFSSARSGGKGKDDIYRADIPEGLQGLFDVEEVNLDVFVKNKETGDIISGAGLKILEIPQGKTIYEMRNVFTYTMKKIGDEISVSYKLRDDILQEATFNMDKSGKQTIAIELDKSYIIIGGKTGFKTGFVQLITSVKSAKKSVELLLSPIKEVVVEKVPESVDLVVGTILVLDQIFYDFDKSYIRTDASKGLDAIKDLMTKYPEMNIELTAHTDSRGEKKYNQKLSDHRADSAKYYLTSRGIESSRTTALGKGETSPRNHCSDGVKCTETEHQYNRRTEIKITSLGENTKVEYFDNQPEYIDLPKKVKKN